VRLGGGKTPPDREIVDPGAFCEADFLQDSSLKFSTDFFYRFNESVEKVLLQNCIFPIRSVFSGSQISWAGSFFRPITSTFHALPDIAVLLSFPTALFGPLSLIQAYQANPSPQRCIFFKLCTIQKRFHCVFTLLLPRNVKRSSPIADAIWANGGSLIASRML
jgi:hypothetical protein